MMLRNRFDLWSFILREGEGTGGAGDGAAPDAGKPDPAKDASKDAPKQPESVLFPNDGKKDDPPKDDLKKPDPEKKPDPAADWKEYVPDPNKSKDENDRLKAEHDKTKPAEKSEAEKLLDTVPEDGKYALTMPDGVKVDQELLDALGPKFAAKKLTTREAQELADEFIKVQQGRQQKRFEDWGKTVEKWADDAKADKDIGGDKWDGTVKSATRAINRLGTPALKQYLQASGGGNHPELIRFAAKAGELIREDNPETGGPGGAGKPADAAHTLYPNDAPKG